MISKIMSTPVSYAANYYANNCTPKKNSTLNFNSGLQADFFLRTSDNVQIFH